MPLNETSEEVMISAMQFVHVHKVGPFEKTAKEAWGELTSNVPALLSQREPRSFLSLYKCEPEMIYNAGIAFDEAPSDIPAGLEVMHFAGGRYLQFTLTGPYDQLPEAVGRVFNIIKERGVAPRDDYYLEVYANDPANTPAEDLVTHIGIPI